MAKVSLRTGQLKRLGRLSAKKPAKAERVAERMVERRSRMARGKDYLEKNVGKLYPSVPTIGKKGTKVVKAKKGGSFPDLNKDGKITKADILKGRGVIAKGGSKVKKAQMGKSITGNVPKSVKVDTAGTIKKYGDAFKPKGSFKRGKNVVMKTGGKAPKKMMGGGKCKYGC
jgi:hypothetical protein